MFRRCTSRLPQKSESDVLVARIAALRGPLAARLGVDEAGAAALICCACVVSCRLMHWRQVPVNPFSLRGLTPTRRCPGRDTRPGFIPAIIHLFNLLE